MAYPIKHFLLQESKYIKEIDSEAIIYIHERTKAKILIMPNKDSHKSFCIGFRTPPKDSTGVAHILEHSVLCGSKKYPLKDPFVELAKGSLNTYLNAMTYPDKTLYPISSQNDKDFHNLMDVYLDAVFFPNIYSKKEIMMQEGWRYHLEQESDDIEYKGVVYNEMKGAFSSPEEIGFRMIKETLFPDTTYANESGGEPKHIPELTYEAFIDFHKTYYHPSNAYICLYGDINVEQTLAYLDKEYLSHFDYLEIDSHIEVQQPFDKVKYKKSFYSATEGKENGLFLSYNTVVDEVTDRKTSLALSILEYILLDTPASPLKKALISEGIGDDVYGAFQTHLRQPIFTIVAKNVPEAKKQRFYEIINETLERLCKEGIDSHLIRGAIQVKEFELREGDASGYSKGLFYALAAMKSWIYDASPYIYLEYERVLEEVKSVQSKGYFESLIKKYLLNNTHASCVELYPKVGLEKEIEEEVTAKLKSYKQSLSKEQLEAIIKDTKSFAAFQETQDSEEAISCIPLLNREDLRREAKFPHYVNEKINGTQYIITPVVTNKIVYMNWYIKLEGIKEEYIPYIGMIVGMLGKLDTEHYTYEALCGYMDEHIGSMSYHIQAINNNKNIGSFVPLFSMQSKALASEVEEQVALMREILVTTKFDNKERLLEIIREIKSLLDSVMSGDGHRVAYGRLISSFSAADAFEEKAKGLEFYETICHIEKNWNQVAEDVIEHLKSAYKMLNSKDRLIVGLTLEKEEKDNVIKAVEKVVETLSDEKQEISEGEFKIKPMQEALIYPTNVNYVALGYNFRELGYKYHGGLQMLKTILSMGYLWTNVRVQNGAYGCFCDFRKSGNMFFVSYRDPNIDKTLDIYKGVVSFLKTINLSDREMLQYLIGTISQLDFPYTAASEGRAAQIYEIVGVTKDELQKVRDELFETDNETLRSFSTLVEACLNKNQYCVFANNQQIELAHTVFTTQTII